MKHDRKKLFRLAANAPARPKPVQSEPEFRLVLVAPSGHPCAHAKVSWENDSLRRLGVIIEPTATRCGACHWSDMKRSPV